jgi:hypothetical protein
MFPKQCGVINPRGQTRSKIILKPFEQGYGYTEHIFNPTFSALQLSQQLSHIAVMTICTES